ncbi:MAG: diacylglycerol kinase family protein [Candidatus Firestonebacteria bacterium]
MRNIKFIVNPISGDGKGKNAALQIENYFKNKKTNYSIDLIPHPGKISFLVKNAVNEGYDIIVAVGGDGTINGVVNEVFGENVLFGIIPVGFGNDFARHLRIPKNISKACKIIENANTIPIDVGKIKSRGANDKYFINSVGFGFDGLVLHDAEKSRGKAHSLVRYIVSILKTIRLFKSIKLKIMLDKTYEIDTDTLMIVIGNSAYEAGGFKVTPNAKLDDGLLDICILKKMSKFQFLIHMPKAFYGNHMDSSLVMTYQAKTIDIFSDSVLYGHIDGEKIQSTHYNIKVIPKILQLIVP